MSDVSIYEGLTQIFRDIFMRDDIVLHPETTAKDIEGWDSFKMIEIFMGVEEAYGFSFDTREVDTLKNVGELVAIIARRSA